MILLVAVFKSHAGSMITGDLPSNREVSVNIKMMKERSIKDLIHPSSRVIGVRCFAAAVATIFATRPPPEKVIKKESEL